MSRANSRACTFLGAAVCSNRLVEIGTPADLGLTEGVDEDGGTDDDLKRLPFLLRDSVDIEKELRRPRLPPDMSICVALVENPDFMAADPLALLPRHVLARENPESILLGLILMMPLAVDKGKREGREEKKLQRNFKKAKFDWSPSFCSIMVTGSTPGKHSQHFRNDYVMS